MPTSNKIILGFFEQRELKRPTQVLAIEVLEEGGYLLIEFDRSGKYLWDNWFVTLDQAKNHASYQFPGSTISWQDFDPIKAGDLDYARWAVATIEKRT